MTPYNQSALTRLRRATLTFGFPAIALSLTPEAAIAEERSFKESAKTNIEFEEPESRWLTTSINSSFDFVAPAEFSGSTDAGSITVFSRRTDVQQKAQISRDFAMRIGVGTEQYWFNATDSASVIPNRVQSFSGSVGFDYDFWEKWTLSASFTGGIYSDFEDISADDFNFRALAYLGYQYSPSLFIFAGVAVAPDFQIPVLPAAGVRWRIDERWTLNAVLPKPTLEYKIADGWKVYGLGQLAGGTFRVSDDFGQRSGRDELDNRWISYLDLRVGGGIGYTWNKTVSFRVEAGSSVYRNFEYEDTDFSVDAGPAFYSSAGLSVKF